MTSIGYKPITMICPAAPEKLLKIVKFSCQGYCDSANRSCSKNGLKCSSAFKNCKGVLCKISEIVPEFEILVSGRVELLDIQSCFSGWVEETRISVFQTVLDKTAQTVHNCPDSAQLSVMYDLHISKSY